MLTPIVAMIRKDLQVFFSDRRSVLVSFVVPIAIASFFGSLFTSTPTKTERARVEVAIVDQDGSVISKAILTSAQADENLKVATPTLDEARAAVRAGKTRVAVILPRGFGEAAGAAMFSAGDKPSVEMLYDPSRSIELAMVRGVLTQHVMQAVSREMFGGAQGRSFVQKSIASLESAALPADQKRALTSLLKSVQDVYEHPAPAGPDGKTAGAPMLTLPYAVKEEAVTGNDAVPYNGYAHAFGGMAIQFLLFAMAALGIEMLLDRQRGIWKRLRAAPISKAALLAAKTASGTAISLMILIVSFAFAMVVFHVRIQGSLIGFAAVAIACALMAATFGLLIAALGNTPGTAHGITTLAILLMVMLGGAWVPTFAFPAWVQRATVFVPVRWAMDGLDAMTWRGLPLSVAVVPTLVLLGFAALFATIAVVRFRWEES